MPLLAYSPRRCEHPVASTRARLFAIAERRPDGGFLLCLYLAEDAP